MQILITAKDEASKSLEGIKGHFKEIGIASAAVGGVITAALGSSVKAAIGAETSMTKVRVAVGSMGEAGWKAYDGIMAVAKATVDYGFDDEDAALSVAKLFQRTKDLTKANELHTLAMDLARAKSIDLTSASDAIGMVLSGNTKILKQFGVVVDDTKTPMQQLAELQDVIGGSADAYQSSIAGLSDTLKVQFGNIQEAVGEKLIPILSELLNRIYPVMNKILDWMEANPKLTQTIVLITAAVGGLMVVLPVVVGFIVALMSPIGAAIAIIGLLGAAVIALSVLIYTHWEQIKDYIANVLDKILDFFQVAWGKIKAFLETVLGAIKFLIAFWLEFVLNLFGTNLEEAITSWRDAWTLIKEIFVAIANWITEFVKKWWGEFMVVFNAFSKAFKEGWSVLWGGVANAVRGPLETVKTLVKEAMNWVISQINSVITKINNVAKKGAGALGVSIPQIDTIPALAEGGIVTRPTLAMVGEAGPEAVIPLSRGRGAGAAGMQINITVNGDISGEELVEKIGDRLTKLLQLSSATV